MNLQVIGIEEEEEIPVSGIGHISNEVIEENMHKLRQGIPIEILEAQRTTPNKQNQFIWSYSFREIVSNGRAETQSMAGMVAEAETESSHLEQPVQSREQARNNVVV